MFAQNITEQEYIPVGCILSAVVAIWGVSAKEGECLTGRMSA